MGFLGTLQEGQLLSSLLVEELGKYQLISIVVGPEGGLFPSEETFLVDQGFKKAQWSPFVLRSELAGVFAVAIIQAFLKRG